MQIRRIFSFIVLCVLNSACKQQTHEEVWKEFNDNNELNRITFNNKARENVEYVRTLSNGKKMYTFQYKTKNNLQIQNFYYFEGEEKPFKVSADGMILEP